MRRSKTLALAAAFGAAFFMAGCADRLGAGIERGARELDGAIENIKAMNDAAARAYVQAPCAVDVGAYYRVLSPDEQRAVAVLCGGPSETPVTAEDVKRARELLDVLKPPAPAVP